jgi:hypothetical protein
MAACSNKSFSRAATRPRFKSCATFSLSPNVPTIQRAGMVGFGPTSLTRGRVTTVGVPLFLMQIVPVENPHGYVWYVRFSLTNQGFSASCAD